MTVSNNMRLSAIAPQIMMKPYSHHAFYQKWTVAQSPAKHEQNEAFCISGMVVLQTIQSAQVGGVELIDERNHSGASRGRGIISQDMQDVGVKGLNHSATVSSARAVADADFI